MDNPVKYTTTTFYTWSLHSSFSISK